MSGYFFIKLTTLKNRNNPKCNIAQELAITDPQGSSQQLESERGQLNTVTFCQPKRKVIKQKFSAISLPVSHEN